MKLAYQTNFSDGSTSLSEPFDPDDLALICSFPEYNPETDIGDRPPIPTREISSRQRPSKKNKYLSAIPSQTTENAYLINKFSIEALTTGKMIPSGTDSTQQ